MKDLSIVIKANEKDLIDYIEILSNLLKDYKTDLIIINNELTSVDTIYNYSLYSFSEDYEKFADFCFTLCRNNRIMIIEDGMIITTEIAEKIEEELNEIEYNNLICNLICYLNPDKSIYFIRNHTLIYNRGIKGFEKNIALTIDDTSFIDIKKENLEANIHKLINGGFYNELYVWYVNCILNSSQGSIKFYEIIEKKIMNMNEKETQIIENIFLNENTEKKYYKYIELKKALKGKHINKVKLLIKSLEICAEDTFYSYILYSVFINKGFPIIVTLGKIFQTTFLSYLLATDGNFYKYVYSFIKSYCIDASNISNRKIETCINIIRTYIVSMSFNSDEMDMRSKILDMFMIYIKYSQVLIKRKKNIDIFTADEKKLIININELIEQLEVKYCEYTIQNLRRASFKYSSLTKIIGYYIQKIRYESNMHPYKLSICMIVKDEEKNIRRCLSSLVPLLQSNIAELIIVDTGSKDKTIEISKEYTEKISFHKWQGNFSEARNYCISIADGEYIFTLDADEEFEEIEIKKLIKEFEGKDYLNFNTLTFQIKNFSNLELTNYSQFTQHLIFKNDGSFYYSGDVHNQPQYKNPVKNLDIIILHYGYIMTDDLKQKKFDRTATMLKKQLEKNPHNAYYRYQLCASYSIYGNNTEALRHAKILMDETRIKGGASEEILMFYNNAALIYLNNFYFNEVIKICNEALKVKPDFIDFLYYKAEALYCKGSYKEALLCITEYLSIVDDFRNFEIIHDGKYCFETINLKNNAILLLLRCNYKLKNYEDCLKYVDFFDDEKSIKACLEILINSCFKIKEYIKVVDFYKNKVLTNNKININELFITLIKDNLIGLENAEKEKFFNMFEENTDFSKYIDNVKSFLKEIELNSLWKKLMVVNNYDVDDFSNEEEAFICRNSKVFDNYNIPDQIEPLEIRNLIKLSQIMLSRTLVYKELSRKKIAATFKKYIWLNELMIKINYEELLDDRDKTFLQVVSSIFDELTKGNAGVIIELIEKCKRICKPMGEILGIVFEDIIPDYKSSVNYKIKTKSKVINYNGCVKTLEENITSFINNGELDKALKMLNISNACTPEAYSLKAMIYIQKNQLNKAETELKKGIKIYPLCSRLFYELSLIYNIKNEREKALEMQIRARLIEPNADYLKTNKIIPIKEENIKFKNSKILHGRIDLDNQMNVITTALTDKGFYARALNYYSDYTEYSYDYSAGIRTFNNENEIVQRILFTASKLIPQYDIFHFHLSNTLMVNYADLPIIKDMNKKAVMQFYGFDVRLNSKTLSYNPYAKELAIREDEEFEVKKKLESISKYINYCIVCDYETKEYVKDYFNNVIVIPQMIDVNKYKAANKPLINEPLLIVYKPQSDNNKGEKYILPSVEELKSKYNFKFISLKNLSKDEEKEFIEKADLIIDRLLAGSYGLDSIKYMAMGKSVMCNISDFLKDKYPKELPIIPVNPDNIKAELEYAINNKDMLYELGEKGRAYAARYHDANKEINKIIDVYKLL